MLTMIRRYRKAATTAVTMAMIAMRIAVDLDRSLDHTELRDETGRERHARLCEQEDRERDRHERLALGEPLETVEGGIVVAADDEGDHTERTDDQHRVEEQVQLHRRDARARDGLTGSVGCCLDTDEEEPGVAHRRIGEHPLDVGLDTARNEPTTSESSANTQMIGCQSSR